MSLDENHKVGFNNASSVVCTFSNFVHSWSIMSADDNIYVEPDGDATTGSHLVIQDTYYAPLIPCKTLGVLGQNGAGIAEVQAIPAYEGVPMKDVFAAEALKR